MCTVTFVPLKNGFCITSNRDEKTARKKAIPPQKYIINSKEITFPKDAQAGGTWFAHSENAVLVLLNGAIEKHKVKSEYRKSRGLIVLDLIAANNPLLEWENIDLNAIEPFTIVLFYHQKLYQLQWNELEKSTIIFDENKPHIWSSSTLYAKEIRIERANWFEKFIAKNDVINAEKLLGFHQFTENQNSEYGLQINRNNFLKTVSITQCVFESKTFKMNYLDLMNE